MERRNPVIPKSSSFPRDSGIPRLSFDGTSVESWNEDREYSRHLRALVYRAGIEHSASIDQCRQAWSNSSKGLRRRAERTHKSI